MARYDEARARQVYQRLIERVSTLPGVQSVGMALTVPLGDLDFGQGVERERQWGRIYIIDNWPLATIARSM